MVSGGTNFDVKALARELRQRQTSAEEVLWALLRNRQLGFKFRRQVPIDSFVVDFYCAQLRLVIEVDGGVHDSKEQAARDQNRDAYFHDQEMTVMRLRNEEVLRDPVYLLQELQSHLATLARTSTR